MRWCVCISVCVLLQSDSTLGLRFPRKKLSSQFPARLIAALIVFVDSDKESRYHLSVPPIDYELPFIFVCCSSQMLCQHFLGGGGGGTPGSNGICCGCLVSSLFQFYGGLFLE